MADEDFRTEGGKRTRLWWTTLAVRWSARLSAAVLLGLVLLIFIGEGLLGGGGPNLAKMDGLGRLMFASMLVSVASLAVIWWRELLGGLLVVGATAAFYWLNYQACGRLAGGAFPLFFVPGVLAIASWLLPHCFVPQRKVD
jgi:hypothetical protein